MEQQYVLERKISRDYTRDFEVEKRVRKLDKYYSSLQPSWFSDKNNLQEFNNYLELRKKYFTSEEDYIFLKFE